MLSLALTLVALVPATAEARPPAPSTEVLLVQYCWAATEVDTHCPLAELTLSSDGTAEVLDLSSGATGTGHWSSSRGGKQLTVSFPAFSDLVYEGDDRDRDGCFEGVMSSAFYDGVWAGCVL